VSTTNDRKPRIILSGRLRLPERCTRAPRWVAAEVGEGWRVQDDDGGRQRGEGDRRGNAHSGTGGCVAAWRRGSNTFQRMRSLGHIDSSLGGATWMIAATGIAARSVSRMPAAHRPPRR
jgi:hypothetical protein